MSYLERLLFVAVVLVYTCNPSLQHSGARFPRQHMPGPGHGPMERTRPGRPATPRPGGPPPPVDSNFVTSCRMQRERSRHIECDSDDLFSAVQCMGPMCFCVDRNTGERINAEKFSMRERNSVNCSAESRCPNTECARICHDGYRQDANKCQLCECNAPSPPKRCSTISKLVVDQGCSCNCLVVDSGDPGRNTATNSRPPGPRTRMRMSRNDMCPRCNTSCNNSTESRNTSCVATTGQECQPGTTLKSVGPHGRTECVEDLTINEDCKPEMSPRPRYMSRPNPTGALRRMKIGEVGESPPPCKGALVCREIGFKKYVCKEENTMGPCVMAHANYTTFECDANGFFKPVQCGPVPAPTEPQTVERPVTTLPITTTIQTDFTDLSLQTTRPPLQTTRPPPQTTRPPARDPPARSRENQDPQFCRCVDSNGTTVEGTEERVERGERRPDCRNVLRHCHVPGLDGRHKKRFRVEHGEDYFDVESCRTCECRNGDPTAFCSSSGNCSVLVPHGGSFSNCSLEGEMTIPHDQVRTVGCETCGCKDGRLRCTKKRRRCELDERDPCDRCMAAPPGPRCGPDGRNHLSYCTAVQCAGIPAVDLQGGPCQSQDACEEHPCSGNKVCINKRGTVACMGRRGCAPHHLRTCVDVNRLNCPVVNESEFTTPTNQPSMFDPESTSVCGSDGVTYQSLCHLLQTSTNVRVLYAGPCDTPDCQTGEVCGTDGLTYASACELQNQAAVRVDYPGECISNTSSLEELCQRVLNDDRCVSNDMNCDSLVFPEDGCCPICGGSVQIVIDVDALSEASSTNSDLQTVDSFTLRLLQADDLQNISNWCSVEASLTITGHLQIVFKSRTSQDSNFCYQTSKKLESLVNNGTETSSSSSDNNIVEQVSLPQAFVYVMAASSNEPVNDDTSTTSATGGAANLDCSYLQVLGGILLLFSVFY